MSQHARCTFGRCAVKITGRTERIAYLDPETAAQVVADGMGSYLDDERDAGAIETASVEPPENAAARTGRALARRTR